MKRGYPVLLLTTTALVLCTGIALAATKAPAKKPPPKPAPKPAPKLGSIGTAQLPGEWCEFGKAYTLGTKAKGDAMNVTLKSAEYTIGHVRVGNSIFWPEEGQKFLVIRYSLHNPLPAEQGVDYRTISWTAVDAKSENKNQEYLGVGVDDKNQNSLSQSLKPAQKIEVFAIIRVDAYGPVPKLMAARLNVPAPVARYDLKGKVKPLPAPYADPSDETGATVAKKIPGVIGTAYVTGDFLTKVEKIEFAEPPLFNEGYTQGNVYVLVTLECTKCTQGAGGAGGSYAPTYGMKLEDEDGVTYQPRYNSIHPSVNRDITPSIEQGESGKYRVLFEVPKGTQLKRVTLKESRGLPIVVDVSSYKAP